MEILVGAPRDKDHVGRVMEKETDAFEGAYNNTVKIWRYQLSLPCQLPKLQVLPSLTINIILL